jgi:TrmH family RNA methyltransferase
LILVGNEGRGLQDKWEKFSISKVKIPQPGRAESLNVAVSAGILIYEAIRQRSMKGTCKS